MLTNFANRLRLLEEKFGGMVGGFSEVNDKKHTGGDRFHTDRYAAIYAKHFPSDPKVIVECGVFKGTGLAVWCELFPEADVIGLDNDPSNFDLEWLQGLGAFQKNLPEVIQFDKYTDSLDTVLDGPVVDVLIDDSCHKTPGILTFLDKALPYLNAGGVVFVEDNKTITPELKNLYNGQYKIDSYYSMAVMKSLI